MAATNSLSGSSDANTYSVNHTLLAFSSSTAAADFTLPKTGQLGGVGSPVEVDCGKAFVIVNETLDTTYGISEVTWSFDFFSPLTPITTVSGGSLTIIDNYGNGFASFLRDISKKLGVAETCITFVLLTNFTQGFDSTVKPDKATPAKPLIFNLVDISGGHQQTLSNTFNMNFMLLYNSVGQMPMTTTLNQFTITNSENSPAKSVPTSTNGKPEILSRKEEDKKKKNARDERMQKSQPMRTLGELFNGFKAELKEMRFEHKAQLQEFLSIVRPSNVKKIKTPSAKSAKSGSGLDIDFDVTLDVAFANYPIDNRNLMTEQVEVDQNTTGISSITIPAGYNLFDAIDVLMKTSKAVGKDAKNGFGYKVAVTSGYDCEGILRNHVGIRRYQIPHNEMGDKDTATNAVSKQNDSAGEAITIEFNYLNARTYGDGDNNVFHVTYASTTSTEATVMEEDADNLNDDPVFSSSQREAISFERSDTNVFTKSGFSGIRAPADPENYGLESAAMGALVDSLKHRFSLGQNTLTTLEVHGSPNLYSDLARNPKKVIEGKVDGASYFRFPEFHPMYVKLKIKLFGNTDGSPEWYHTYHYHLAGVTNNIFGGQFTQTLRLLSTDDSI